MKTLLFFSAISLSIFCRNNVVSTQKDTGISDSTRNQAKGLKPQMAGFALRDFESVDTSTIDPGLLGIVNSLVLKVNWNEIQPTAYGDIKHPNIIDDAVQYAKSMNAKYPGMNLNLKLRLYCGIYAPDWVKKEAGAVTMYKGAGLNEQMARFWEPVFMNAFADVQHKLSQLYDTVPEITEVVDGGTGTNYAEALIRHVGNSGSQKKNASSLLKGAYTQEKDIAAIKKSIDIMKTWKHTRISMAFSAFDIIKPSEPVTQDMSVTKTILDYFVSTLGEQAVMGNNGLRDPENGANNERWAEGGQINQVYKWLKEYNRSGNIGIYFQTATYDRIGDINKAMESGIANGAGMIELPGGAKGILKNMSISDLKKYDQLLEAQAKK